MACPCQSVRGLGESLNHYDGRPPKGVPNPYGIRVHAYPTRFHGPIYTRPMFGYPWKEYGVEWGETPPQMDKFPDADAEWGTPIKGLGDAPPALVTPQPMLVGNDPASLGPAEQSSSFAVKLGLVAAFGAALVLIARSPQRKAA